MVAWAQQLRHEHPGEFSGFPPIELRPCVKVNYRVLGASWAPNLSYPAENKNERSDQFTDPPGPTGASMLPAMLPCHAAVPLDRGERVWGMNVFPTDSFPSALGILSVSRLGGSDTPDKRPRAQDTKVTGSLAPICQISGKTGVGSAMGPSGDFVEAVFHAYVTSSVSHVQNLSSSVTQCVKVSRPVQLTVH